MGPATVDADDLLRQAKHHTGLADIGDPWFLAPLHAVVDMINRDAGLPSKEVFPVRELVRWLSDRLRLVDYVNRHPEIRDEKLNVAGVIVAARGGSTLLQRLLGTSRQLTSTRTWELIAPTPYSEEPSDDAVRKKFASDWVSSLGDKIPAFKAVHPTHADEYDEELGLMDRSFLSLDFQSWFNLPGYLVWHRQQDHEKSYEELKLWLQSLQFQKPERRGQRWLLKSIQHLVGGHFRIMLRTFPQAKVIFTHRRLDQVIPSLCSSQSLLILPSECTNFDKHELGPRLQEMYVVAMKDMLAAREREPTDRFIDILYRDLISDPLRVFRETLQRLGLTVTPEDEIAAREWMAANSRNTEPPHAYRLEDYGLTERGIKETFAFYHDKFLR
jgi:hypothetical protein